jgi:type III pantothenate kinase
MGVNLVIDSGNHSTKYYLFSGDKIVRMQSGAGNRLEDLNTFLQQHPFDAAILSSVVKPDQRMIDALEDAGIFVYFSASTPAPLKIKYGSPETLGPDRIAAALAGWQRSDGGNVLVIVAGTCITYNIVESGGSFAGGAISPGLHMRLEAMHTLTGRLPLVKLYGDHPLTGTTTETSLRSGALNGAIAEVKGMIAAYGEQYPSLKTIISGGDTRFLAEALKNGIFARPELVAEGLNTILNYNVSNRLTR